MTETQSEDAWVTVQDRTPAPPLEHPYAVASGDRLVGIASRELVEDLGRPTYSHPMEGKAFFHHGPDGSTLTVQTSIATTEGIRLTLTRVYLTLLDEPGVLGLSQPILDALRGYAMDWPNSAHRIHWHERVGVPVIARIRHVASLLSQYRDEWEGFRDERDNHWTAPAMARVGLVEPDPDPAVVAARVAEKWPGLWGKYGAPR